MPDEITPCGTISMQRINSNCQNIIMPHWSDHNSLDHNSRLFWLLFGTFNKWDVNNPDPIGKI